MDKRKSGDTSFYFGMVAVALVIGLGIGYFVNSSGHSAVQSSTIVPTHTATVQQVASTTIAMNTKGLQRATNNSTQIVKEALFVNKTVTVPAPTYNQYYNYVTGCYWIDGAYNLSFYAPYAGYLVFNETNTGIPANFTTSYFGAYISTQKPRYFKPQPYNETSFCPGFNMLSTTEPWVAIDAYNNQTLIVPIKNGTNYILFYNGNANQEHGVNPFPINVTFSITYYGFRGFRIPQTPNTTVPTNIIPEWSKYGGG